MSFFNKNKKPIFFITKNFNTKIHEKSDVVLSPEFYWAKRVSLNVKFKHEVKKMAASIFADLLPEGNFEYKVLKLASKDYIIVAYDLEFIQKELVNLGIDMLYVDKIYTAQSELLHIEDDLKVDDNYGLVSKDNVIVYLPLQYVNAHNNVHSMMKNKNLSYDYIYSHKFQKNSINPKQLNLIVTILLFCMLIIIFDFIKLKQEKSFFDEQKELFITNNNFPRTKMQIKSMQDELSLIDSIQRDIRESLSYIDKFKLHKTEYFSMLKLEKNKMTYKVQLENKKRESLLKNYIAKKDKNTLLIEEAK